MNEKKLRISTAVMTVIMLILGVVEKMFAEVSLFETVNSVINPLLFIATLVCAYLGFKNEVSFESKWLWVVIAIQFTYVLGNLAYFPVSAITYKAEARDLILHVISTAGLALVLAGIFTKKLVKLLPAGFVLLALHSLTNLLISSHTPTLLELLGIVVYALFAVLTLDKLSALNGILRTLIVILSVICSGIIGVSYAISLIILAFIIVPAGKAKLGFAKVCALLCIITAVLGVVIYFSGNPGYKVSHINNDIEYVEESIAENEEYLIGYTADLAEYEEKLESAKKRLAGAQKSLSTAEKDLDKICDRDSYSSWYCDTPSACRPLHTKVDNIEGDINDFEWEISDLEWDVENTKSNITYTEQRITDLKEELSTLRTDLIGALFMVLVSFIAIVLSAAGLVLLAITLCKSEYDVKPAVLSCILLAAGSLLSILVRTPGYAFWSFDLLQYPFASFVLNPYFVSILVTAIFAALFTKTEGKRVMLRVFAIIAAILMAALSSPLGATGALFILYAATVICISLLLVPPTFTEYNSIAKIIFFNIITLGIWNLIWIYNVTKNLSKVSERKPAIELLFCIFLPFYYTYWLFKTSEAVEAYGAEKGKSFKNGILCRFFAVVCPFVSVILIQDNINGIVGNAK